MPEIEITDEQHAYLEALREDIQTQVVGKYAHVRLVDAVQYLIDNHEGEINATVDPAGDGASDSGGDGSSDEGTDGDDEADTGGEAGEETDGGSGDSPVAAAAAGGGDDDMLSAMMALLDTHDDKWEKADGGSGYEVELPDGSTETANTQDDVRALLFKHYE